MFERDRKQESADFELGMEKEVLPRFFEERARRFATMGMINGLAPRCERMWEVS